MRVLFYHAEKNSSFFCFSLDQRTKQQKEESIFSHRECKAFKKNVTRREPHTTTTTTKEGRFRQRRRRRIRQRRDIKEEKEEDETEQRRRGV